MAPGTATAVSACYVINCHQVPPARLPVWTPRIANAVRACTFRPRVFEPGDTFQGRPKMHFTRLQLERELTDAGFSPVAFYVWGTSEALVARALNRD